MIARVSHQAWEHHYRKAFESVFAHPDPFNEPFTPGVECKTLLFPVSFLLDQVEFQSIASAARKVGDSFLCLSVTEGFPFSATSEHWTIGLEDYAAYSQLGVVGILENALYSPSGLWGFLISHEQHAVVGGNRRFVGAIRESFPGNTTAVQEFLETFGSTPSNPWVNRVMNHIFGERMGS